MAAQFETASVTDVASAIIPADNAAGWVRRSIDSTLPGRRA